MKILLTVGDVNGVGLEAFVKALVGSGDILKEHEMTLVGNINTIRQYIDACKLPAEVVGTRLEVHGHVVELLDIGSEVKLSLGAIDIEAGALALQSIEVCTKLVLSGKYDAVVTLPVSKFSINLFQKGFTGHTDYIASICKEKSPLMILFTDNIRVALATTHVPIYLVSRRVTQHRLLRIGKIYNRSLKKDFGINSPQLAMLSINPHGGENGTMGKEELQVLIPSITIMKKKGINISGAFASDGFFAHGEYLKYDGVLAMYHDQGLIPLKILSRDKGGVNFTANLPIVRTSPDHGTAFSIAGNNSVEYKSTLRAIIAAVEIQKKRYKYKELTYE